MTYPSMFASPFGAGKAFGHFSPFGAVEAFGHFSPFGTVEAFGHFSPFGTVEACLDLNAGETCLARTKYFLLDLNPGKASGETRLAPTKFRPN